MSMSAASYLQKDKYRTGVASSVRWSGARPVGDMSISTELSQP